MRREGLGICRVPQWANLSWYPVFLDGKGSFARSWANGRVQLRGWLDAMTMGARLAAAQRWWLLEPLWSGGGRPKLGMLRERAMGD